jgi:hypothetical protein
MALVFADLVQETTSTTGVGTLTLTGAVAGFQTFGAIGNANTTYYRIKSGNDSEVGIGTYTSAGTTLSRDTVLYSSAGGTTKITVAAGATVICTYPAGKAVLLNASGTLVTTLDATISGITVGKGLGAVASNTAVGVGTLAANTSGSNNSAFGVNALAVNTTGTLNTAVGVQALTANNGTLNSAVGVNALQLNTTGVKNSAVGVNALQFNVVGGNNSAFGYNSGQDVRGSNNVVIGAYTGSAAPISYVGSNYIVLSDGAANIRTYYDSSGNQVNYGVKATSAAAPTIASATAIAPTKAITFISGVTPIDTITVPSPISLGGGTITLIPTGIFTTTIAGNIALASTAVVGRALTMTYDAVTTKWYPSY